MRVWATFREPVLEGFVTNISAVLRNVRLTVALNTGNDSRMVDSGTGETAAVPVCEYHITILDPAVVAAKALSPPKQQVFRHVVGH